MKDVHPSGCFWLVAGLLAFGMMILLGLWGAGAFLIEADSLKQADALVVLSGDTGRLIQADQLFRAGYGKWLILTAVVGSHPEQEARALGLPGENILVSETRVSSTRDEGLVVKEIMQTRKLTSCIIITDPFHTQRARWIFRDVFKGSGIETNIYPVQNHWYRSQTWWQSSAGWQVTLQEYFKLAAYMAGFRID